MIGFHSYYLCNGTCLEDFLCSLPLNICGNPITCFLFSWRRLASMHYFQCAHDSHWIVISKWHSTGIQHQNVISRPYANCSNNGTTDIENLEQWRK